MTVTFVSLEAHFNAHAATFDQDRSAGFVNPWGNSFPAEEIPFNRDLICGEVPFRLGRKGVGRPDHVESLGQEVTVESSRAVRSVGLLAFAELGEQALELTFVGRFGERHRAGLRVSYWLSPTGEPSAPSSWRASHLHYAAGYELDRLVPTLHSIFLPLSGSFHVAVIELGANPLVHVMAITLLDREARRA